MRILIISFLMGIISAWSINFFMHIGISFIVSLLLIIVESSIISLIANTLINKIKQNKNNKNNKRI